MGDLWIFQFISNVLSSTGSNNLLSWLNDSLDDMDGISSSTMSSSHFAVHLGDGSTESAVSILFVHVDDTSTSKISKHDSVILDIGCLSLKDLTD